MGLADGAAWEKEYGNFISNTNNKRKEVWNRKEITKLAIDNMFALIQNEQAYTEEDINYLVASYKAVKEKIDEDFVELTTIIRDNYNKP